MARRQLDIVNNQEEQKKSQAELKDNIIKDSEQKLEAVTGAMRQAREADEQGPAKGAKTYVTRVAKESRGPRTRGEIPSYFDMAKRVPTQRAAASQTDGTLERVYVKDWRKQPVGAVKRALRIAIGTWKL